MVDYVCSWLQYYLVAIPHIMAFIIRNRKYSPLLFIHFPCFSSLVYQFTNIKKCRIQRFISNACSVQCSSENFPWKFITEKSSFSPLLNRICWKKLWFFFSDYLILNLNLTVLSLNIGFLHAMFQHAIALNILVYYFCCIMKSVNIWKS